jgi:4-amino-4-deoxy-L-arabinose transferase-like glycosyltransferase
MKTHILSESSPVERRSPVPPIWFWVAALAVAALWFLTLGMRHLLSSDEGRYAEIAREMFASDDWVTIRYNGLKYFEKPPLHLWMTALSYEAFGVGEWQTRLWGALSGAGALLMTAGAARRWYGNTVGLLTGLVLLAAPTWNLGSHFNSLDIGVSSAMAVALAAVLMAQHPAASPATRRQWMWAAWAAMALAVLTKGLIGVVLPGLVLIAYTALARDWALWRRLHIASGTFFFLALTAPWFVLVSMRNPEFPQFFFIHEHLQRYTSGIHRRGAPLWYFVPQLLAGWLPWLGLSAGMARVVAADRHAPGFKPTLLLASWAVVIFVFFSLSNSKLPGYILPIFPALAVLGALALERLTVRAWRYQLNAMLALAALGLLASPLVPRLGPTEAAQSQFAHYALWLAAAWALLLLGLAAARWQAHGGDTHAEKLHSITTAALAFFIATTLSILGHETLGRPASGADLRPAVNAVLTPGMPLYGVRTLDHTLPFYLQHTLVMVEEPDELEFGTHQEPQKWLPTLAVFRQVWRAGPRALAVMSPDTFAILKSEALPMTLVARDETRVVVANFASGTAR